MVTIRKARRDDAQVIWDIRNAAIWSQCTSCYDPELLRVWTAGDYSEEFSEKVEHSFHVAVLSGRVVGMGMIDLASGRVEALFVRPDCMGQGIGAKLLAHLEKLACSAGLEEVALSSSLNAAPFYRTQGYTGNTIAKYKSPRGITLDCVPMVKVLHKSQ